MACTCDFFFYYNPYHITLKSRVIINYLYVNENGAFPLGLATFTLSYSLNFLPPAPQRNLRGTETPGSPGYFSFCVPKPSPLAVVDMWSSPNIRDMLSAHEPHTSEEILPLPTPKPCLCPLGQCLCLALEPRGSFSEKAGRGE